MFEKLARKILKSEFEHKERRIKEAEENEAEAYAARDEAQEANRNLLAENDNLENKVVALTNKVKDLEEQNAILRQYYSLDKEPSQETKDKMYLDMKYREMDKQLTEFKAIAKCINEIRINAIASAPIYVPYQQYTYPGQTYWPRLY